MQERGGFTLIEMSIVLVIIALIAGGVVVGRDMLARSRLQAVISEYQQYKQIVAAFENKYNQLPGDFNEAVSYWGATVGKGNNNNQIGWAVLQKDGADADIANSSEGAGMWEHLKLAEMLQVPEMDGLVSAAGQVLAGSVPRSAAIKNGLWGVQYQGHADRSATLNANFLFLAANNATAAAFSGAGAGPVITGADAYYMDNKGDDGKPATGVIIGRNNASCATATSYVQNNTSTPACILNFRL